MHSMVIPLFFDFLQNFKRCFQQKLSISRKRMKPVVNVTRSANRILELKRIPTILMVDFSYDTNEKMLCSIKLSRVISNEAHKAYKAC